jgi:UDP-N-acetylglucosamine diphosphorylase/glucosamine-1-phosphate N-acetyltransferase
MSEQVKALVLAAGKGTRLHTEGITLPKVMRQAAGRALLDYVLEALGFLPKEDVILVVGYGKDDVLAAYPDYPYAEQTEQKGTGHAVQCAAPLLKDFDGHVLVCCGDTPLMRRETFQALINTHLSDGNACTLLSAVLDEGGSYGRVLRNRDGGFAAIVEAKDCTPEQAKATEVNTGTCVFRVRDLLATLNQLRCNNAQGEYYLTDVPALIQKAGGKVGLCDSCAPVEMLGVNTPEQLAQVEAIVRGEEGTHAGG